ncbi:Predicted ATPase [Vibrio xiamenensis]|uniref:Predicted ATPase n=1 Tax=Vibrio xiamenensis TaxID=861298 RepID=A0A1G8H2J3_9VIBR|nr:AAA family ATPase [Vibrio xiamenensis]SDI00761.1 Predicted ATPase [Vibrio xiamenensis]
MKKILITGVFGTGKTTLINMIENRLKTINKNVKVISEVARECPFKLNHEQNAFSTSWLIMRQMENELKYANENYDFIIYDRGLPDIIAHTKIVLKNDNNDLLFYKKLEDLGKVSLDNFDYIFLSKRSDKYIIQEDGIRVDDVDYQKSLEYIHVKYLRNTGKHFISLDEDNESRLNQILGIIC